MIGNVIKSQVSSAKVECKPTVGSWSEAELINCQIQTKRGINVYIESRLTLLNNVKNYLRTIQLIEF